MIIYIHNSWILKDISVDNLGDITFIQVQEKSLEELLIESKTFEYNPSMLHETYGYTIPNNYADPTFVKINEIEYIEVEFEPNVTRIFVNLENKGWCTYIHDLKRLIDHTGWTISYGVKTSE